MPTSKTSWPDDQWEVVLLVVLASFSLFLQASISWRQVSVASSDALSAPVHSIYGKALKQVYALEFAKQTSTNAEVFYIKTPLTNQTTPGQ